MTAADTPRRIALVVNALTGNELSAGNRDAARVYDVLTDPALGTCSITSPKPIHECESRAHFEDILFDTLEQWRSIDQLVFYFSGHGQTIRDGYCLKLGQKDKDFLPFANLLNDLQRYGVQRAILILDACYSGAASNRNKNVDHIPFVQELAGLPKGIAFIASSRASEASAELPDGSASVFTDILCKGIRSGLDGVHTTDGYITIEDICAYIRSKLESDPVYAVFRQRPIYEIHGADRQIWIAKNISNLSRDEQVLRALDVEDMEQLEFTYKYTDQSLHPCENASTDDIDWSLLEAYSEATQSGSFQESNKDTLLSKLGLISPITRKKRRFLHKSAILCFAHHPEIFYPQVQSILFVGDPGDTEFIRKNLFGPLSHQVQELVRLTANYLDKISVIGQDGLRKETDEIDRNVIREVISNAIVHRDYTLPAHVQVRITSEAVEIISPGRFPENTSWQTLINKISFSNPVNPKISLYMSHLHAFEGGGRGFDFIKRYIDENGSESISCIELPAPAICIRILRRKDIGSTSSITSHSTGSLPPLPTYFIGRDDDVLKLKQQLRLEQTPRGSVQALTAVRGWPGVGKTTLAAVLAYDPEIMQAFPDGVLWASLGQNPSLLTELRAWGRVLGVELTAETIEQAMAQLAALLRDQRRLLIVDDVWEEGHAAAFRVGGRNCALLFTTRLPQVAEAIVPPQSVYILGVLNEKDALELLRILAPHVVAENPEASRELVQDLEGLPIAIQVAGHLLNVEYNYGFSVLELLAEIRAGASLIAAQAPIDRMDLANQTTPTVAALLKKSTDLLNPQTLECFAYLGAFAPKPATFDSAALKSVWQVADPWPTIRTLVDRGLLEPLKDQRFWMHALLVMHARSFLGDDLPSEVRDNTPLSSSHGVRWKHAAFYAQVVNRVHHMYATGNEQILASLALFDYERSQIEQGWQWLRTQQITRERDELFLKYAEPMMEIGDVRYTADERIWQFEELLDVARRLGRRDVEANALDYLGFLYTNMSDYDHAQIYYDEALALRRLLKDSHGESATLNNVGVMFNGIGAYDKALASYKQALSIAHAHQDASVQGSILGNLGDIYNALQDYEHARSYHEQALEIKRNIGDRRGEGITLANLGINYLCLGQVQEAMVYYEQALNINRELGDRRSEGRTLGNLGLAYVILGEQTQAIACYEEQLAIFHDLGDRQGIASASWNLGHELAKQGNIKRAITLMQEYVSFLQEIGHADMGKYKADLDQLRQSLQDERSSTTSTISIGNAAPNQGVQGIFGGSITFGHKLSQEN